MAGLVKRSRRVNGEGSIYPYPHGYRAYSWVTTPDGKRRRKYVTAKTREGEIQQKLLALQQAAYLGMQVPTTIPTLDAYMNGWLTDIMHAPTSRRRP